jgi:hypothetical protein
MIVKEGLKIKYCIEMLRINEFDLEPGPYSNEKGFHVVVTDVINHSLNTVLELPEVIASPMVVCRDLMPPPEHRVYMIDISYFRKHFSKK